MVFADTDTRNFRADLVVSIAGCLLVRPEIRFVKAAYRRPFKDGELSISDGGGRVTELLAKPLLNVVYPELAGFVQPLAGEFGGTKELLCSLPFFTGYAVEIGLLIDAWVFGACGLAPNRLGLSEQLKDAASRLGTVGDSFLDTCRTDLILRSVSGM